MWRKPCLPINIPVIRSTIVYVIVTDFGDIAGITSLMLACMKRGQHEMTRLLLDSVTSDVTSKDTRHGRTALHFAARVGDKDTLEALINAGIFYTDIGFDIRSSLRKK